MSGARNDVFSRQINSGGGGGTPVSLPLILPKNTQKMASYKFQVECPQNRGGAVERIGLSVDRVKASAKGRKGQIVVYW